MQLQTEFQDPTLPIDPQSLLSKIKVLATAKPEELALLEILRESRPEPLRSFDQIPMYSLDLLYQVKLIAPRLKDRSVVFIGDLDGTSILLGMLASRGHVDAPKKMLLLDFDGRLISVAKQLAREYYFSNIFSANLYNVFDPIPPKQQGVFDWFYTNPPYGSNNGGSSACLFIERGIEHLKANLKVRGSLIIPSPAQRDWARKTVINVREFLSGTGWMMKLTQSDTHSYHLDDDPKLCSSLYTLYPQSVTWELPNFGKRAPFSEYQKFYAAQDTAPYPRYIDKTGGFIYSW